MIFNSNGNIVNNNENILLNPNENIINNNGNNINSISGENYHLIVLDNFVPPLGLCGILSHSTIMANNEIIESADFVSYFTNRLWYPSNDLNSVFNCEFTDWKLDKNHCVLLKNQFEWIPIFWFPLTKYYNYPYLFFIVKRISEIEVGFINYYLNSRSYLMFLIDECNVPIANIYSVKWYLDICFNKAHIFNGQLIAIPEKRVILSEIKDIPQLSNLI